jgi:putative ABC transport system permease protein
MDKLFKDIRYGSRMLFRTPVVSLAAILTISLAIGGITLVAGGVYVVILRGLPFEDAERIYHIGRIDITEEQSNLDTPIHDYLDWRAQQTTFEDLAA